MRSWLLLLLIAVSLVTAACTSSGAALTPIATPREHPWPSSTVEPHIQGTILILRAEPADDSGNLVRFVSQLVGGPDHNPELFCTDIGWDLGDGTIQHATPGCVPPTEDTTVFRGTSDLLHRYREAGVYYVIHRRGPLESRLTIQVPLAVPTGPETVPTPTPMAPSATPGPLP